ncbi:hypothetical protein GQX74_015546 [Glossina fuscipes]|nr:hypothetical protein GQX74_015546 [Glossina fuscipes]
MPCYSPNTTAITTACLQPKFSLDGWLWLLVFFPRAVAAGANVVFRFNTLGTRKIRKNVKMFSFSHFIVDFY